MTEGAMAVDNALGHDDGPMHCYRHPDRETYVRCGRCDRPICTRCAMQGPVGFRCKNCGTLANDPLTTFRPTQLALGLAIATIGGIAIAMVTGFTGWFGIIIAFFGGGIIAETVTRTIGFKRGPKMIAIVMGGIIVGSIVGSLLGWSVLFSQAGLPGEAVGAGIGAILLAELPWLLISTGAACVGAYTRLRG
jgi:hypothetical protein